MIPTPKTIAAVCHVIRTMPRAGLDWTHAHLTDAEYRQHMEEIAETVGSMDEDDVVEVLEELDTRTEEAA